MKRRKSIKGKVLTVLLLTQIPLMTIIIVYNIYFVNYFNRSLSDSNRTALASYCDTLEEVLNRLNTSLLSFVAGNTSFKMLTTDNDYLSAHLHSLEVVDYYDNFIEENSLLYGCYIINNRYKIFRESYLTDQTDYHINEQLRDYFRVYLDEEDTVIQDIWEPLILEDRSFLYMVKGIRGTYAVSIVDVSAVHVPQDELTEDIMDRAVVFFDGDQLLNEKKWIQENQIKLCGQEDYYFSGAPRQFLIIEQPVEYSGIRAAYLVEYHGLMGNMSQMQQAVILLSLGIIIIIIPVGFYRLKRVFFNPIDRLVGTMTAIREGRMETRADEDYSESEFLTVNQTFNAMVTEINDLKIESYEKELDLQKTQLDLQQTQLDYYQTQIRPHFYVNCLKSIHGLLEEGRMEDAKDTVAYLSRHLRYMLKGPSVAVSLEEELNYVKNYIQLQKISMAYPPSLTVEIEDDLKFWMIPAISILSFVENSVKYGGKAGQTLEIGVYISKMRSEEGSYLNISISDNGPGFDEEMLVSLNECQDPSKDGHHVGIYNVMQRFILYYGKENVLFAFSNMNGACVDIFIKEADGQ